VQPRTQQTYRNGPQPRFLVLGLFLSLFAVVVGTLVFFTVDAKAVVTDPVADPTYWNTIWDKVGALNPSASIDTSTLTTWAGDNTLVDATTARVALSSLTYAEIEAGALPAEATLLALASPVLVPALAVGAGVAILVGTGAGQRLVNFVFGGLFGTSTPSSEVNGTSRITGQIKWFYQSPLTDFSTRSYGPGYAAEYVTVNTSTGVLSASSSAPDCKYANGGCTSPYAYGTYGVLLGSGATYLIHESEVHTCTSGCLFEAFTPTTSVNPSTTQVRAAGVATPDFTTASGGAQSNPGTSSATATAVRNAITANPTLHQQFDCQLDPADFTCPTSHSSATTVTGTVAVTSGTLTTSPAVIVLPRPALNESVQEWMDRLVALGYTGAATVTYLGVADTTLGQAAPAEITYGATTIDLRSGHAGWPTGVAQPTIAPNATLTIVANTTSAPELSPQNCTTCSIDWTPITGISYGSKFPFGTLSWLSTGLGTVTPSGTCPTLDITDTAGGATHHISFCNTDWETNFRPWVFPLLEALMTLAAIAFFGSKLLGSGTDE